MSQEKGAKYLEESFELLNQPSQSTKQQEKWTLNLILCCLTISTAAFQFGYNLSSLNSATLPLQLFIRENLFLFENPNITDNRNIPTNQTLPTLDANESEAANNSDLLIPNTSADQEISKTVNLIWTLINCLFVFGQFLGGYMSKYILEYLGRKKGFLFHNIFTISGSLFVLIAFYVNSPVLVMIGRFVYGLECGIGISITPIYLSEIPPDSLRGGAGAFFQLFISFGIIGAQLLGFKEIFDHFFKGNSSYWHFLLGFPIIPAVFGSILFLLFFPESPKALLIKDQDYDAAKRALQLLRNKLDVKEELDQIHREALQSQESISFKDLITSTEMRWPLITTIIMFVGLQLSGINAIFFYSTGIFLEAGISPDSIQYAILLTGLINIPANIACMPLIDKFGRKSLYLSTVFLIIIDYCTLTILLTFKGNSSIISYICIGCILIFIVLFALAVGPIPGIYASEVFRQNAKGAAFALGNMIACVSFLFVAFSFPILQAIINQYVFLVFAGCLTFVFLILLKKMPETKGKSIDEIVALF